MATVSPLRTPWIATVPADTNEHILSLDSCITKNQMPSPAAPMKVIINNISAPVQFAVAKSDEADVIDANIPSYTTTDEVVLTVLRGQEIRFVGGAGSETFEVVI